MHKMKQCFAIAALASLSGCAQFNSAPPATADELQKQLAASEARLQQSLSAQQQSCQAFQQQLFSQFEGQLTQTAKGVKSVDSKLSALSKVEAKPVVVTAPNCPALSKDETADGKMMVGEAEWIWIEPANDNFQARVDTGATTSSISAQDITIFERNGKNWVRFSLNHKDVDEKIEIEAPLVRHVRVRQASADDLDRRPVVRLTVRMGKMTEKAEFTLKDRSDMTFPVLLGREFLKDIAVVDVAREYVQPKPKLKEDK